MARTLLIGGLVELTENEVEVLHEFVSSPDYDRYAHIMGRFLEIYQEKLKGIAPIDQKACHEISKLQGKIAQLGFELVDLRKILASARK